MCFKIYGYKHDFNALSFASAFIQNFCVKMFPRRFNFFLANIVKINRSQKKLIYSIARSFKLQWSADRE